MKPKTLGERIRCRRRVLGLTQKEACPFLGNIAIETLINWEKDKTTPPVRYMPAILQFLGGTTGQAPGTLADQLQARRTALGWSIKRAAKELGIDERLWARWEHTGDVRWERYGTVLEAFLANAGSGSSGQNI